MAFLAAFRRSVHALQQTRYRMVFAALATLQLTARYRKLVRIRVDKAGDWTSRQPAAAFVAPAYSTRSSESVEAETADIWSHYFPICPGDMLVDIGAGTGDHLVSLSRAIGAEGRILAIEAHPRTFRCLQKTIAANRLGNVTPLQLAAGDAEGQVHIEDSPTHISNRTGCGALAVPARPLDAVLADLEGFTPSIVKMNIEGAEVAALRGARQSLRTVPRWIVSCHDFKAHRPGFESSATLAAVLEIFRAAAFDVRPLRDDRRPWIRYYVYAERRAEERPAPSSPI